MYRKDLITAEIQKLAQVLARIMGLKLEGKLEAAEDLFRESLLKDFGITEDQLFLKQNDDFEALLTDFAFPAEKLEMLSQFLYPEFDPSQPSDKNEALAEKLNLIYQTLEVKHRIVSMTNLDRQKKVQQYLNS
ncbi:hypothetical protein SAMN05421820_105485 [Pedobacter steynii]|uniref:Uncharacterized protein n=1 Tax=Pedobacter steynii TaxID=430522 RepID=A0A1G9XI74_9SPHI|nr:hypothetical protein [Pedobacter steynii]NQX40591.1 hypothetical protein [Pedobacter steynii]SDM95993.1 hypothetical protein SAMN05421820_105485 [Pedobacter steynii]